MRETSFIKQNKEKWTELESVLQQNRKNPDKLSELFVQVTDDLSYSRTFYPNRYVRVYLNNLAQRIFLDVYKNKKERRGKFLHFWKEELPLLVYQSRKEFLFSLLIFLMSFGIGVFSSVHDHEFARLILGDDYVEMTKEYIESGDPMKVYKTQNGFDMFLGITLNNLYVSFITFIYGLLFSVGSIAILLYNGIMVGTFQYFFIERDLFKESFLTIWMHGTIEISCIIIAGAAGIVLGKGLAFPGTYSRMQSLQMSAQRALKIMMGIAPLIVTAAIIESFFTRFTDVPDVLRIGVISLSAFFIIAYFVWYPIQKSRTVKKFPEIKLPPSTFQPFQKETIRNNGEIFGDVFIFFKKHLGKIALNAFILGLCSAGITWYFNPGEWQETAVFNKWQFLKLGQYFSYTSPPLFFINTIAFAINALLIMSIVKKNVNEEAKGKSSRKSLFLLLLRQGYKALIASVLINAIFFLHPAIATLAIPFLLPLVCIWLFSMIYNETGPFIALRTVDRHIRNSYGRMLVLLLSMAIVSFILYFFLDSPLLWVMVWFLKWNVIIDQEKLNLIYTFLMRFFTLFSLHLLVPLTFIAFSFQYFSLKEIADAGFLKQRIDLIGKKNGK